MEPVFPHLVLRFPLGILVRGAAEVNLKQCRPIGFQNRQLLHPKDAQRAQAKIMDGL
jgi:hypothetical protein